MVLRYAIEHMEEDEETSKAIPKWVELEYMHMRSLAGPDAHVHFTHLSRSSCQTLTALFSVHAGDEREAAGATAHSEPILDLMRRLSIPTERVCLLDPKAEKEISPEDGDGRFECFLFGVRTIDRQPVCASGYCEPRSCAVYRGYSVSTQKAAVEQQFNALPIGDDPPRDRTSELRVLGFPTRRLGPIQMTTDTALGVTKLVVQDKIPLSAIPYIDHPTITFNPKESVEMPFRYIAQNSEPRLPPGMREHLHEDLNKSFDF
ncbi:DUF431-domain-containing protein [Fomitopsis serialis]|uniref:DUF431-domain-containing protein n=1 Tax=Fomitopsis serialis TaxID=139415 RepID=UPI0020078434|nr:DUF431-domain-containing protein [Neoantrodia serialis]KAH9931460.1 DUF431-domain-containing protein [Neoantrodia serialis]